MFNELTKGEIMKNEVNRASMAKKKIYKQPEIEVKELQAMSIICASITKGGDAEGDTIGD